MKKVEVNVEFVMKAHNNACGTWKKLIEQELPDLFKEPEYHRWYLHEHQGKTYLFFPNGEGRGVGFTRNDQWISDYAWHTGKDFINESRLATDEEIIARFKPELEKRGILGSRIKIIADNKMKGELSHCKMKGGNIEVDSDGEICMDAGDWKYTLYIPKQDRWTEAVPELTEDEIFKKYGVAVKEEQDYRGSQSGCPF